MTKQPQPKSGSKKSTAPSHGKTTVTKPSAVALLSLRKSWNALRQELGAWHKIQHTFKFTAKDRWSYFLEWKLVQKAYSDKGNLLKSLKEERKADGLVDPANIKVAAKRAPRKSTVS